MTFKIFETPEAAAQHIGFDKEMPEYAEMLTEMKRHAEAAGVTTLKDNELMSLHVASLDQQDDEHWQQLCVAAAEGKDIEFDDQGNFKIDGKWVRYIEIQGEKTVNIADKMNAAS